eukprot:TRINITY_DN957_c0_g2_i2.p1 TRINITY_DN957_c0_g2~~TRINITY_DN957_c0_g2_i2.p1  ORF type:complete len:272 (+),score=45.79 TRINITY_DN957_c0_g2_i2:817-1632(+)
MGAIRICTSKEQSKAYFNEHHDSPHVLRVGCTDDDDKGEKPYQHDLFPADSNDNSIANMDHQITDVDNRNNTGPNARLRANLHNGNIQSERDSEGDRRDRGGGEDSDDADDEECSNCKSTQRFCQAADKETRVCKRKLRKSQAEVGSMREELEVQREELKTANDKTLLLADRIQRQIAADPSLRDLLTEDAIKTMVRRYPFKTARHAGEFREALRSVNFDISSEDNGEARLRAFLLKKTTFNAPLLTKLMTACYRGQPDLKQASLSADVSE